jgi:hypothetical protein
MEDTDTLMKRHVERCMLKCCTSPHGNARLQPWNHQPRNAVRHDDVAAGPDDSIAKFLKHTNGVLVPDARKSGHNSNGHFGFADFEQFRLVRFCRQPFLDRLANIL